MDNITIYEYAIIKGKLVKKAHDCEYHKTNMYRSTTKNGTRFFYMEYADQVKSGRVFSCEDNESKFFKVITADLESRIESARQSLAKQERVLADIKSQMK